MGSEGITPLGGRSIGGNWMRGGKVMPPFWFCLSISQGVPPLTSSRLCGSPLPGETTGESVTWRLRRVLSQA
jgi:hypothetical protein